MFSTGQQAEPSGLIPWRTSKDLAHWTLRGRVFDAIPRWAQDAVPGTRGLWAPDIARFNDQYHLYYSCSTFGSNHSVIGLVTNATLDPASPQFEWRDRGLVVSSKRGDDFNAIDPNHFVDRDGAHWLCLGSFWSGIKLFRIDPATGKPPPGELRMHSLAARPVPEDAPGAIEAPFMIERGGYYYLFASYRLLLQRREQLVLRRRGPFARGDRSVRRPRRQVDAGRLRYAAPAGQSALSRCRATRPYCAMPDRDYLVYHAYDAQHEGRATLRISPIVWTDDGWPTVEL